MRAGALLILVAIFALLAPGSARADCTDSAGPGVDWRRCIFDRQELRGLDLSEANLRDSSFTRADLSGSKLVRIEGFRARFVSAKLNKAVLDEARLVEADLTKADLAGASLVKANLARAHLFRAILTGANLTGANLRGADLLEADLSGATWVDGKRVCANQSIGRCD
jgi:uncharacterized protein YjbI with pentapeptide repeats